MVDVTILSLNLRFGLADDGPNGWEARKEKVVRLFLGESPDLIAIQEANDFQTDFLANRLSEYRYVGKRSPAPPFWQDNILFFRRSLRCLEHRHFFLSETPQYPSRSFGSQYPRQGTLGVFDVLEKPLICINTHFDFEAEAQLGASRVLKEQLAVFPENVPVILAGDFNATPDSACYRRLTGDASDGEGMGFKETFESPYPSTFHRFTGKPVAGYIDWILFRGDLRLKSCGVLEGASEGIYVSDHFPVNATFEIAAP